MTDHARLSAANEDEHLRRIILGLFDPMPDGHPKGCLANENGPCQCGYAEVAGKYLWALREAKKIAAEHYGHDKVDANARMNEPQALVEAAQSGAPAQAAPEVDVDGLEEIIADLRREKLRLHEALRNMMGAYDTPLARRRFPPDEFMKAALESGRDALAAQPPAAPVETDELHASGRTRAGNDIGGI